MIKRIVVMSNVQGWGASPQKLYQYELCLL
jgi:hypothetical protein